MVVSSLQDIFDSDDLGLLETAQVTVPITADEHLVVSFSEINDFVSANGREPSVDPQNIPESTLAWRLASLRKNESKIEILKSYDIHNLLKLERAPKSIDDIMASDDMSLLEDKTGISTITNVPKSIDMPNYIGRQKPCKNFEQFELKFVQCHSDLESGKRQLRPFAQEQQIDVGEYFVLKGVIVYIDKVGSKTKDKNGKTNARLRVIYENGTESDILLRSLARELYRDGRRITEHDDRLLAGFEHIDKEDQQDGYIYILSSLSSDPKIAGIKNLYKIGFSTTPVEKRIANAANDPTYLMAPVHIMQTYRCYNLNPQKFEALLHRFFTSARLDLSMIDNTNHSYVPDEWFVVPFPVIDHAIQLIINGEIIHYAYDYRTETIVEGDSI